MVSATFDSATWPGEIVHLLDDHHLVVLSDDARARRRFSDELAAHLRGQLDTQLVVIEGAFAADLLSFCRQLETRLRRRHPATDTWWRDAHGVITMLRDSAAASKARRRYFIW